MYSVAREFSFSYGHRLYGYQGRCRRLHGHNALVRVEVAAPDGRLNDDGMALDFVELKEKLGNWIDEELDHRVFLKEDDPLAFALQTEGEMPVLMKTNPTAEAFAEMIGRRAMTEGLLVLRVEFWETKNCRAAWTPY